MSSYVFSKKNTFDDCPTLVVAYLSTLVSIKNRSKRTVNAYYIDLRLFFRYILQNRNGNFNGNIDNNCNITGLDKDFFESVTKLEVLQFMNFLAFDRETIEGKGVGLGAAARARKLSAIKGFYKYLVIDSGAITNNPVKDIETPKINRALPKHLSLDESKTLLDGDEKLDTRIYCILILFLNCGMRLSELCGINITDIRNEQLKVIGKGNKERTIYLNRACMEAINSYLDDRNKIEKIKDNDALFISQYTGNRLSARRIQQLVEESLKKAGLDGQGYSAHKLRHTAATLLYRYSGADMLSLKEILGHEHVSTTEIYTHISDEQLKKVVSSSPLAQHRPKKD